jgi:hypothetical protein
MPVMSQRAYSRQRGVSASTVQKAIASGRIHTLPNGQIDSEIADAEWARNTQTQAPPVDRRGQQPEDDAEVFGASQYTKARAVREHYQARLAKIDYEERIAKLVSGEEVQVAAFNKFRQFRDAMINLPDRLAAMLAAETVETTVHTLLTNEIRKALNDFADESNG